MILDFKILDTRATVHGETGTFICDLVVQILAYLTDAERKEKFGSTEKWELCQKKKEANGKNNLRKYAMKQRNITKVIKMEMSKKVRPINVFLETTKLLLGARQ